MAAVEVTAPMAPVVVNGLRFKGKPEAEVVPGRRDSSQGTEEDTPGTSQTKNRSRVPGPALQELLEIPLKAPTANPMFVKEGMTTSLAHPLLKIPMFHC